jgi:hypothetical protein
VTGASSFPYKPDNGEFTVLPGAKMICFEKSSVVGNFEISGSPIKKIGKFL